jgi:hypothetical protein
MNIQSAARDIDFHSSLAADSASAAKYFDTAAAALESLGAPSTRSDDARKDAQQIKLRWRAAQENYLRRHVGEIYDTITGNRSHCVYASCSMPWPIVFQACSDAAGYRRVTP